MFSLDTLASSWGTSNALPVTVVDGVEDSDDGSEASDDRLHERATVFENRLQGALQLDERTSSLVSLESIPRKGAEELGRQVAQDWERESLAGGGDDRSICTIESLLSEAKRNRQPTFIKVPAGDPAILTQQSWDNIMANELGKMVLPAMEEKAEPWETLNEQKEEQDEKDEESEFPRVDIEIANETGEIEFTLSELSPAGTSGVGSNQENVEPEPKHPPEPEQVSSSRSSGDKIPKRKWRLFSGRKASKKSADAGIEETNDFSGAVMIQVVETQITQDVDNGVGCVDQPKNEKEKETSGFDGSSCREWDGPPALPAPGPYYEAVDEEKGSKKCGGDICGGSLSFG